jgi:hypothetical protein
VPDPERVARGIVSNGLNRSPVVSVLVNLLCEQSLVPQLSHTCPPFGRLVNFCDESIVRMGTG